MTSLRLLVFFDFGAYAIACFTVSSMKPRATCMLGKHYTSNHIQERWDNLSLRQTRLMLILMLKTCSFPLSYPYRDGHATLSQDQTESSMSPMC